MGGRPMLIDGRSPPLLEDAELEGAELDAEGSDGLGIVVSEGVFGPELDEDGTELGPEDEEPGRMILGSGPILGRMPPRPPLLDDGVDESVGVETGMFWL